MQAYSPYTQRLPLTPNSTTSPPTQRECLLKDPHKEEPFESNSLITDYPREVTWLFFRENKWIPFQSNNHHKIEQAFTLGGIYVDIHDINFPHLKTIRVFPTRMYLSYLGMKYRLSCVIQG
ncbi:hypothetical protein K501DRAFT_250604 [Backusella circina FSU 941]|nr:hypothetical protein K501DRAFT_250604 [Backusella circina FSU 941]